MSDESTPPKPPHDDEAQAGPGATPPPPSSGPSAGTGAGTPPPGAGATGAGAGAPPPPPPGGGAGSTGSAGPGAPPPPSGSPPPAGGAGGNRQLMIVLSYLWILALIPYLTEQQDAEVKWHARHGLVLLVAEIVVGVIFFILGLLPILNCLFGLLSVLVWIGIVILHVICLVKALGGERFTIPYVSQYADQIP